jgi:hypothetical protein
MNLINQFAVVLYCALMLSQNFPGVHGIGLLLCEVPICFRTFTTEVVQLLPNTAPVAESGPLANKVKGFLSTLRIRLNCDSGEIMAQLVHASG